jgi:large subunit ribosomal protein L11
MIVVSGQPKPSPAVGQTLGPLGINMMHFFKEFTSRTTKVRKDVPLQVTIVPFSDKTYKFAIRTPSVKWFIRRCSRTPVCGGDGQKKIVGNITLKEVFHIAKMKCMDPQFVGMPLRAICISIVGSARAMGIEVTRDRMIDYKNRDDVDVQQLDKLRKDIKAQNKLERRNKK